MSQSYGRTNCHCIDFGAMKLPVACRYISEEHRGMVQALLVQQPSERYMTNGIHFRKSNREFGKAAMNHVIQRNEYPDINIKRSIENGKIETRWKYEGKKEVEGSYAMKLDPAYACGMVLSHLANHVKQSSEGCGDESYVISVPYFWKEKQIATLMCATRIAEMKNVTVVDDLSCIATYFGYYKNFHGMLSDKPETVLFVDVGQSNMQVGVYQFKENSMTLLSRQFSQDVCGDTCTDIFFDICFEQLVKANNIDEEEVKTMRTPTKLAKMRRASLQAKNLLCHDNLEQILVDLGSMDYEPFTLPTSEVNDNPKYIKYCEDFYQTVKTCLAQIPLKDGATRTIDRIEVVGGAMRLASLKKKVVQAVKEFNRTPDTEKPVGVSTTLNDDECVVSGGCILGSKLERDKTVGKLAYHLPLLHDELSVEFFGEEKWCLLRWHSLKKMTLSSTAPVKGKGSTVLVNGRDSTVVLQNVCGDSFVNVFDEKHQPLRAFALPRGAKGDYELRFDDTGFPVLVCKSIDGLEKPLPSLDFFYAEPNREVYRMDLRRIEGEVMKPRENRNPGTGNLKQPLLDEQAADPQIDVIPVDVEDSYFDQVRRNEEEIRKYEKVCTDIGSQRNAMHSEYYQKQVQLDPEVDVLCDRVMNVTDPNACMEYVKQLEDVKSTMDDDEKRSVLESIIDSATVLSNMEKGRRLDVDKIQLTPRVYPARDQESQFFREVLQK